MKLKEQYDNDEDWHSGIIQGTPFCDCGTLMVCLDGIEFICPNPDCDKRIKEKNDKKTSKF